MNISPVIEAAASSAMAWSRETFTTVLNTLAASVDGAIIDWDEGAGENWGRVLLRSEVVAIVCRRHPLMVVKSTFDYHEVPAGIYILIVDDMSSQVFTVERSAVEKLIGRAVSTNLDAAACSIDDIWWATAT
jgi:hypothetical protein